MREVILRPIRETRSDYEKLQAEILKLLRKEIYLPLLKEISVKKSVLNSSTKLLVDALIAGHIRYEENGFVGVFSADVSKELRSLGAVWSKRSPKWLIRLSTLSMDIQDAVSVSVLKEQALKSKITRTLSRIEADKVVSKFDTTKLFKFAASNVNRDFEKSVAGIVVAPRMSEHAKERIASEYSNNLKLYIKEFTEDEIIRLRKEIEEHVFKGNRYESIVSKIQDSYGISKQKAKFLAKQETSLLTSKIKETRYQDVGIDTYIWQTVNGTTKHPVRPLHKQLNGKTCSFSNPPVSGPKGERQNPGEPFNCRCTARPVVKFT